MKTGLVHPVGAVAVNETVPLKRLSESTCIVEVTVCPETTDKLDGEAEMLKSGVITCTVNVTE